MRVIGVRYRMQDGEQRALTGRVKSSTWPAWLRIAIEARLNGRMARQRRLFREYGPAVTLLVDMASLYRAIGSAAVMAAQCARLAELAGRPNVVVQVVPPVTIPLATASLMITDAAA